MASPDPWIQNKFDQLVSEFNDKTRTDWFDQHLRCWEHVARVRDSRNMAEREQWVKASQMSVFLLDYYHRLLSKETFDKIIF